MRSPKAAAAQPARPSPSASPRGQETASSSHASYSTSLVSDAGTVPPRSPALVPPAEIRLSNEEILEQIHQLKNEMTFAYCDLYVNEEGFIENVDKLVNILFALKKLKLQETGHDATEWEVLANTLAATLPQEILDLVPEVMLARVPEKFKRRVSQDLRTDPVALADNVQKLKLQGTGASNTATASVSGEAKHACIPEKFKCPISKELMTDPVILANGQTCSRPHIEANQKKGIWICPITGEVLENDQLTPNLFARNIISEWCKENVVGFPETKDDESKTSEETNDQICYYNLTVQLARMKKSLTDKVEAAKIIRKLTKKKGYVRQFFSTFPDSIPRLLEPLKDGNAIGISHLQEDLIASVFHILAHQDLKIEEYADSPKVIPLIVESMRAGTIATKIYAAAALLLLSEYKNNKLIIGRAGALKHLIELVEEGHPSAMHVAAKAISSLCLVDDNVGKAIEGGVIEVVLKKINAHIFLDNFTEILLRLSKSKTALAQMSADKADSILKTVMDGEVSVYTKINCSYILHYIHASSIQQGNRYEDITADASDTWRRK